MSDLTNPGSTPDKDGPAPTPGGHELPSPLADTAITFHPGWPNDWETLMPATRSKWPAAAHLQQAADELREVAPGIPGDLQGYADPVAEWLDKAANEMAWLAPFREHEGGYRPWRVATRTAHGILGLPDPDTCVTCHTHTWARKAAQS